MSLSRLRRALREHWPEALMEAAGLGLFMLSAGLFGTLLEAPGSPLRQALEDPFLRRGMMGLLMGATAVGIIYSPWGRRSGAHINPAVTLTFLRLGKIAPEDAALYVAAQFAGGLAGVLLLVPVLGQAFAAPPVLFVVTVPGTAGAWVAFVAEVALSFVLMTMILWSSNQRRLERFTGVLAGTLVGLFIAFEAPLSGMSINPARTVASAAPAGVWTGGWLYLVAPPLGMLAAAQLYVAVGGLRRVYCAKLDHHGTGRCIFRCRYDELVEPPAAPAPGEAARGEPSAA